MYADFLIDRAAEHKRHGERACARPWLAVLLISGVLCIPYLLSRDLTAELVMVDSHQARLGSLIGQSRIVNSNLAINPASRDERNASAAEGSPSSFLALQNLWETVWSIDAAAAEINEANIVEAKPLRERAERGDLEATVLLLGAAGWCASAGPLLLQQDGARGGPSACVSRFGADIDSRESLDRAIFRWTMQLANAGLSDATLYASVLGREQLFAPALAVGAQLGRAGQVPDDADVTERLRGQLIGQLQTMVSKGSVDAASELNGYYLKAVAEGEPHAALARHYASVAERLDPARIGLSELTEEWIRERATTKRQH